MENLNNVLLENAREYYKNAVGAEERDEYNTAVTLFFKVISSLCDLYILIKEKILPSNHSERFRVLESKYPDVYSILDKDFPFYQDSYKSKLNKETCEVLKKDAEKIARLLNTALQ